jgi:hypothetical protein
MGIDARSMISPPRPANLLLNSNWNTNFDDNNNNMKTTAMVIQNDANNSGNARRRKKKRSAIATLQKFEDLYEATGETLGQGSFGAVSTYRNLLTGREFAVKKIMKTEARNRHKVLKEIEIFHHCKGQENIIQLIEYFEEEDCFHMIFEKMEGGKAYTIFKD